MNDTVLALQEDFKLFLQALWSQLDLPSPTRAQYAIADYLQNGPKRLQIQAFRGVGKSWITGAFVLWTLFNDPERKIMIISASKERADNMSIFLQKLIIETPWLEHLRPKSDDSRWSRISFDVNCSPHQAPSVKSVGITGQLTGSRADLMILDDIEVPGNSMAQSPSTQIGRFSLESHQLRRKLFTSPSTKRKVGGNYWTAHRKSSRSHDFRRYRGSGQFYDGVNA